MQKKAKRTIKNHPRRVPIVELDTISFGDTWQAISGEPTPVSEEIRLLREIRDLLKALQPPTLAVGYEYRRGNTVAEKFGAPFSLGKVAAAMASFDKGQGVEGE